MQNQFSPTLDWLMEFEAAFGQRIDLVLEARPDDPVGPTFNYGDHFPAPHLIPIPATDGEEVV